MEHRQEDQSQQVSSRPRRTFSLRQRLLALLGAAFLAVLLVNGATLFYLISQGEQLIWQDRQVEAARLAANTVADFVQRMQASLVLAGLPDQDTIAATPQLMDDLLRQNPALLELVRLDSKGHVFAGANQDAPLLANLFTIPQSVWFTEATAGQFHLGNVQVSSGEPYLIMAIPAPDGGVVAARLRMDVLWDVVAGLRSGETGQAYVVDQKGRVVAHTNPEVALAKTSLQDRPELAALLAAPSNEWRGTYVNFENERVVGNTLPVSGSEWVVITEVSQAEVSAISRTALLILGIGTVLIGTVAMVVMAWSLKGLIFQPLAQLQTGAERIGRGDLQARIDLSRRDEIGQVAGTFNQMATQLQDLYTRLEERGHRLEKVTGLSERLNAILYLEALLAAAVNQIKEEFDYYHVHIYLLDETGQKLVVAEGVGQAGQELKATGHSIALDAPRSLVARAARNGEVVKVDNVREAEDWLPNPLLPDTYAEMAVPILLEDQVVGVLDVQEDEIAGLDDNDARLLRLVANQVAVGIRNARQFAEVETSLAEAHEAQQRYVEQAWDRSRIARRGSGRIQHNLAEATDLPEAALAEARRQALAHKELAVVPLNGGQGQTHQALVAPIMLLDVPIGDLQLHGIEPERRWTEGELALIKAVVDQVAQVAESIRLLDDTQERAGRERLIGQVSDKLRRAPDLDSLMQTAVGELSRILGPDRAFVRLGSEAELGAAANGGIAEPDREPETDIESDSDEPADELSAPANGRESDERGADE